MADQGYPRTTPVDGYNVIEWGSGVFKVMEEERQIGSDFVTFSAAYKFIQRMNPAAGSRP